MKMNQTPGELAFENIMKRINEKEMENSKECTCCGVDFIPVKKERTCSEC